MSILRRNVLLGAAAAALMPVGLVAAVNGVSRRYQVLRGGDRIGSQSVTVRRDGGHIEVEVAVEIRVRVLGITAYRYEMTNTEIWDDGRLMRMDARTDDDGTRDFARARRDGGRLMVEGSGFSGEAPEDCATTTYWTPDFLGRRTWISTQTGRLLSVRAARRGTVDLALPSGKVSAEKWQVTGDLDLELFYADGEWVGNRFAAKGETAEILAETASGPRLTPLFAA